MAVLKGNEEHVGRRSNPDLKPDTNAVIGNKSGSKGFPVYDEIILKKSAQVLPLIKFETSRIANAAFADTLWSIHSQIQHKILDDFFNNSVPTKIVRVQSTTGRPTLPVPNPFPQNVAKAASNITSSTSSPTPKKPPAHNRGRSRSSKSRAPSPSLGTAASLAAPAFGNAGLMAANSTTAPLPTTGGIPALFSSGQSGGLATTANGSASVPLQTATGTTTSSPSRRRKARASRYSSRASGAAGSAARFSLVQSTNPTASGSHLTASSGFIPPVVATMPSAKSRRIAAAAITPSLSLSGSVIAYTAPETLAGPNEIKFQKVAAGKGDCSICISELAGGGQVVKLPNCEHHFHQECIQQALKHNTKCPECRVPITSLKGKGPSGTMTIITSPSDVSGFSGQGSIVITYILQSGKQKAYHENPGVRYSGTSRIGYLPDNAQGKDLLKRLKYAFAHGLTFSIGTSLTTHTPNVITWGSVHHKTSPSGGVHGFPDPNYFINANSELDGLEVPPADQL